FAAVEGGVLPPGSTTLNAELTAKPTRESAGQDARLYGRRDARRYAKRIRTVPARSSKAGGKAQEFSRSPRPSDMLRAGTARARVLCRHAPASLRSGVFVDCRLDKPYEMGWLNSLT